jgi:hypothetical protein
MSQGKRIGDYLKGRRTIINNNNLFKIFTTVFIQYFVGSWQTALLNFQLIRRLIVDGPNRPKVFYAYFSKLKDTIRLYSKCIRGFSTHNHLPVEIIFTASDTWVNDFGAEHTFDSFLQLHSNEENG